MYLTEDLRRKVLQYMIDSHKTQTDIADYLGVSQTSVSKWLNSGGRIDIKKKYASKLCELVGLDYVMEEYSQTLTGMTNINTAEHGTAIQNNSVVCGADGGNVLGAIYVQLVGSIMALPDVPAEDKVKTIQIIGKTGLFGGQPETLNKKDT